ncbi:MAG TPA: S8 family peptidase [Thermoanaerobaculia bacterium]|nr:S8 family peptidase [Thermoanaerobaculia bacterium]
MTRAAAVGVIACAAVAAVMRADCPKCPAVAVPLYVKANAPAPFTGGTLLALIEQKAEASRLDRLVNGLWDLICGPGASTFESAAAKLEKPFDDAVDELLRNEVSGGVRAQSIGPPSFTCGTGSADRVFTRGGLRLIVSPLLRTKPAATVAPNGTEVCGNSATDPCKILQRQLSRIGVIDAWRITKGDGVVVAVLDTGVAYRHPDLTDSMFVNAGAPTTDGTDGKYGYDAIHCSGDPDDVNSDGHGTHVAGIIAATQGNAFGGSGIAPHAGIMAVRVLGKGATDDAVARGLRYVLKRQSAGANVKVVNLSWTNDPPDVCTSLQYDLLDQLNSAGILVVAAAGNLNGDNDSDRTFPASYALPNVISVAACGETSDERLCASNYGRRSVMLAAPGCNIFSTLPPDRYGRGSGTSMATAHVSGASALLWSCNPGLSVGDVRTVLGNGVVSPYWSGNVSSNSRLSVDVAFSTVLGCH